VAGENGGLLSLTEEESGKRYGLFQPGYKWFRPGLEFKLSFCGGGT
jgi:hypothetical protein